MYLNTIVQSVTDTNNEKQIMTKFLENLCTRVCSHKSSQILTDVTAVLWVTAPLIHVDMLRRASKQILYKQNDDKWLVYSSISLHLQILSN